MSKALIIAWREFLDTVRTRAFFFGVIFMPGLMVVMMYGGERVADIAQREAVPTRTIAVLDEDGRTYPAFAAQIDVYNARNPHRRFALERADATPDGEAEQLARVRRGELYALLVIPPAAVQSPDAPWPAADPSAPQPASCRLIRRDGQFAAGRAIADMLNDAVRAARFQAHDPPIDPVAVQRLSRDVAISDVDATTLEASKDDARARVLTPFLMMFLIYLGTMSVSMGLLTSVLEEKSSRIMEVLLAAVSPLQLMTGKILGIVAVGMVMVGIWCAVGYASARSYNVGHLVTGYRLAMVAAYFVPALLFSAALLAAVGAACNSLKEAQSMSSPLTLINIVPLVAYPAIGPHPDSALAVVLSFIPPITPFVMIVRTSADPATPVWQIVASLALLWLAVVAAFWVAARVFRIGVLMYGQPPTVRELVRWLRRA